MDEFRILVENEPRSYREVIAETIGALRPDREVLIFEPGPPEAPAVAMEADIVLCSRGPDPSPLKQSVWVELYPNGDTLDRVYVDGESITILDIEIVDLLAIIDQTEQRKRRHAKGTGDG
jgi:hypothetical protein